MSDLHHRRFYLNREDIHKDSFRIAGDELRHMRVKRLITGETVIGLDGEGGEYIGMIEEWNKSDAVCSIIERKFHPPPESKLILALGIIKPGAFAFACEKCAELGVWSIIPLETDFSNRSLNDNEISRMNRITISAMKQSGRFYHARVLTSLKMNDLHERFFDEYKFLYTEIAGGSIHLCSFTGENIVMVVGPEGGFSDDELALMREWDALPVSLNDARLRSETAAIVAVVLFSAKNL